jgi:hypothetical protein
MTRSKTDITHINARGNIQTSNACFKLKYVFSFYKNETIMELSPVYLLRIYVMHAFKSKHVFSFFFYTYIYIKN